MNVAAWLVALALVVPQALAQAPDVKAIQAREALRAEDRLLAYYDRFRTALAAKAGSDPLLSALVVTENEAQVLVHAAPGAPGEHLIWQEGKWISTDGRQLRPWAPGAPASAAQFRLSAVPDKLVRDRLKAYRAQPGHASDFVSSVRAGYFGKPFDRLIVEVEAASMTAGLRSAQFDLANGASLDVAGTVKRATAEVQEAQKKEAAAMAEARKRRKLVAEAPQILAAFRREVGPTRLMGVYIERQKVVFVQVDRVVVDYDVLGRFHKRDKPYADPWLCDQGFDDGQIDWAGFPNLVQKALLAGKLDEEDREHAEFSIERPRECRPVSIGVSFANYRIPQPKVYFDAAGRVTR